MEHEQKNPGETDTDSMRRDTTVSNVRGETGESLFRDEASSLRTK